MSPLGTNDNDDDDRKRASITRFWAIRQCDSLRSAAIFTNWEDCSFYVGESSGNEGHLEFESFGNVMSAIKYILPQLKTIPPATSNNSPDTTTNNGVARGSAASSSRKRSAQEAFSRSPKTVDSENKPQAEVDEEYIIVVEKEVMGKEWIAKFELLKEFKTIYGDYNAYDARVTEERFKGLSNFVRSERRRLRQYEANPDNSSRQTDLRVKALLALGLPPLRFQLEVPQQEAKTPESDADSDDGNLRKAEKEDDDLDVELEYLGEEWKAKFELLKEFKTIYGDHNVYDSRVTEERFKGLSNFVRGGRRRLRHYQANPDNHSQKNELQVKALLALGLTPRRFLKEVPQQEAKTPKSDSYSDDGNLRQAEKDDVDVELEDVGEEWKAKFKLLQEFKMIYGDCDVYDSRTTTEEESSKFRGLNSWLRGERRRIRHHQANPQNCTRQTDRKVKALVALGLQPKRFMLKQQETPAAKRQKRSGDSSDSQQQAVKNDHAPVEEEYMDERWQPKFELLKDFKRIHGDCDLYKARAEGSRFEGLENWVIKQRLRIRTYQANPEKCTRINEMKVKALLELGLSGQHNLPQLKVEARDKWDAMFEKLKQYKQKHGTVSVTTKREDYDSKLDRWVDTQKNLLQRHANSPGSTSLDDERIQRLLDIGVTARKDKTSLIPESFQAVYREKLREAEAAVQRQVAGELPNIGTDSACLPMAAAASTNEDPNFDFNLGDGKTDERGGQKTSTPLPVSERPCANNKLWEEHFQLLMDYKAKFGTCDVERRYTETPKFSGLYRYVTRERLRIKNLRKLQEDAPEKVKKKDVENARRLLELGFVMVAGSEARTSGRAAWDPKRTAFWGCMFEMLKQYKEANGTCEVKMSGSGWNLQLQQWVRYQANQVRQFDNDPEKCSLGEVRVNRLKGLGILCDEDQSTSKKAPSWEEMVEQLKAFKDEHGHVQVPQFPRSALRYWVLKQRAEFDRMSDGKKTTLTSERILQLTSAGFQFHSKFTRVSFDQRAVEWLEYRARHGRDPPFRSGPLGRWVGDTRRKYTKFKAGKKAHITQEQTDKLTSWGFTWDTGIKRPETATEPKPWEDRYAELLGFKEEHGHVNVPQNYPVLGTWVSGQRQAYSRQKRGLESNMTAEKIAKLEAIGFVFLTRKSPLEAMQGNDGKRRPSRSKTAAKQANKSDSSSEEDEDEGNGGGLNYIQQHRNLGHDSCSQSDFAPWNRYKS